MRGIAPKNGHPVENVSGEDIPPRSVVLVTGVTVSSDGQYTWSTVDKYDGTAGNIMVTGDVTIPATVGSNNGKGTAYYDDFLYVSIDPTPTAPVAGDEWGPVANSWAIGPSGSGFVAQGAPVAGSDPERALFYRVSTSSSSGGTQTIQFDLVTVDCDAGTATATVTDVQCGGVTGISVGDTVNLTDPLGFLIGSEALLVGHTGFAVKMETDGAYGASCSWAIHAMDDLGYNC
jgi:hypothetical protein